MADARNGDVDAMDHHQAPADSQGRETRRSPGHAVDQIRAGHQPKKLGIEVPISMQMLADEVID
jgi:hypothetical protein